MDQRLVYLGDGVYVTFDGYQIWLKTQRGSRWEEIALDPAVYKALTDYAKIVGMPP